MAIQPTEIGLMKFLLGEDPISGLIRLGQALWEEEDRIANKEALRNTVTNLTRLYEQGQLSKQAYLKALDAILEEKPMTIDAQIADRLDRLIKL